MADVQTTFATLSQDAPNVWIARQTYRLVERNLRLGKYANRYTLPQRMSKTMRIIRHSRLVLPKTDAQLAEGLPPDAVALAVENVDVTVEQWGIVVLLTDVAMITTQHPALNVAVNRTSLAMAEVLEREMANTLLAGTSVQFPGTIASRDLLASTDVLDTDTVIKTTTALRTRGAGEMEGGLYSGVMAPAQEGDIVASDATFKDASNFANVKALQFGEIGIWMGVRWARGNFMPVFKGVAAPDGAAINLEKGNLTLTGTGGPFASTDIVKVRIVARDINSDYERKISQEGSVTITGSDEEVDVTVPSSTNYLYDIYVSEADDSSVVRKQFSRVAASSVNRLTGFQASGDTAPVAPADTVEVFVAWVFGADSYGRVELNGLSLQSFITPAGASFSNPLAQARKIGSKIMWKSFIIDDDFFTRIETGSAHSAQLPA